MNDKSGHTPALTSEEIDAKIAAWHDAPSDSHLANMPLHEYLGWNWKQYQHWVKTTEMPV